MTRLGSPNPLVADVAATASGGEMMAPSTKASAQPSPGINISATHATAHVVKITQPIASSVMGRLAVLKSAHEVFHAAAYRIGGRKIRNTISGSRVILGSPGISP